MIALQCVRNLGVLTGVLLLAGCSNGRGSLENPPPQQAQAGFTIGGTVSGLAGSGLVLQNNGGNDLAVSANGAITFGTSLADGAAYSVTVFSQPSNPTQSCTVANGTGRIAANNVTNVAVTCVTTGATGAFAVRGIVTGLTGSGLVLQNNHGDDLAITADGAFGFPVTVASGATYNVAVRTQPTNPTQICTITNGAGTMGGADITNVAVTCAANAFSIGGTVSGLVGSGLELQNNGGDDLTIAQNGGFAFAQAVASSAPYNVTVKSQPTNPVQTCTVENPAGTVGSANVTNVTVSCATNQFTVGGTVTGLSGSGLVLRLNGANDRAIPTDGGFAFPIGLSSGTPYIVSVRTQPRNPTQTCAVANATGVVTGSNVTNVVVTCTTPAFSIGGMVTGLAGSGLVLQKNGGDDLAIASNGNFTFSTDQAGGTPYRVTVRTQPINPSQNCTVANSEGTVSGIVRNVRVTCATNTYRIGGAVSGLLGDEVVLQNNGGNDIHVEADGGFTFPGLASGATYHVTVRTQPSNPTQGCTVTNGTGTVGGADITNVAVSCVTSEFTIGGAVSGLSGSGLVLHNGTDDLPVGGNGNFTFPTALQSGATYNVTVASQPANPIQTCSVSQASGTVGSSNVTNVEVSCVTIEFTVGGTVSGLSGLGLVLQNNGGDNLPVAANGNFTFPASLTSGASYNVTVLSQPIFPFQSCLVVAGSGTVGSADVTNVAVNCTTIDIGVGGSEGR